MHAKKHLQAKIEIRKCHEKGIYLNKISFHNGEKEMNHWPAKINNEIMQNEETAYHYCCIYYTSYKDKCIF